MREYQSGQEKADKELTDWPKKVRSLKMYKNRRKEDFNTVFSLRTSLV